MFVSLKTAIFTVIENFPSRMSTSVPLPLEQIIRPISTRPQQTDREKKEFRAVGGLGQNDSAHVTVEGGRALAPCFVFSLIFMVFRISTERMERRVPTPEWRGGPARKGELIDAFHISEER